MTTGRQSLAQLGLGIAAGIAIWLFSPLITGHAEPWDAETPIWLYAWVVIAVLGGLPGRISGVCLPLGFALGQMLFTLRSAFWQFVPLGWTFIISYAAMAIGVTLATIAVVSLVRWLWHLWAHPSTSRTERGSPPSRG